MKRFFKTIGFAVLVAPLLASMGCPESDPIHGRIGDVVIEFVASPSGAGRYQEAIVSVSGVSVLPIDPDAAAALGNVPLGLLGFPFSLSLNSANPQTAPSKRLSPGVYELVQITLNQFTLVTTDPLPTGPTCVDQLPALTDNPSSTSQAFGASGGAVITDFNPAPTVTVDNNGVATLQIVVDALGFAQLMESQYNCVDEVPPTPPRETCVQNNNLPAPCLESFIVPTSDQLKTVISVP